MIRQATEFLLKADCEHSPTNAEIIVAWLTFIKFGGLLKLPSLDEMKDDLAYTAVTLGISSKEAGDEEDFVSFKVKFIGKEKAEQMNDFLFAEEKTKKVQ